MIKIYKPSGSMRSNYRPLEFLICLGLTLGCLWSSTFIKSSMWLGWLIGMGLRLSPNTIAALRLLTFVVQRHAEKQSSRTRLFFFCFFLCCGWQIVSRVDAAEFAVSLLPYCIRLLSVFPPMLISPLLATLAKSAHARTSEKLGRCFAF